MSIIYAIPPLGYTHAQAFQEELERVQEMLGDRIIGFESAKDVAEWLRRLGFRRRRPITEDQVKTWCKTRNFPHTKKVLGVRWFTTSAHVLAWLWTHATYAPRRRSVGVA